MCNPFWLECSAGAELWAELRREGAKLTEEQTLAKMGPWKLFLKIYWGDPREALFPPLLALPLLGVLWKLQRELGKKETMTITNMTSQ